VGPFVELKGECRDIGRASRLKASYRFKALKAQIVLTVEDKIQRSKKDSSLRSE
jgi:hypothetical protein